MLNIQKIDHIGIRVSDIEASIAFYENLGFAKILDAGFKDGHPVIMQHASGVTLNLLGPSSQKKGVNILMDVSEKYAGYTHIALRVESLEATRKTLKKLGIEITDSFEFGKAMSAVFIRDPDRNVIELDEVDEAHLMETMVDHKAGS
ncbi:MAG: VOC family protein [Mariprofundaceae bacterium]